ncbi:MAG: hypothetical protein CMJ52_09410 [Planctomycetaceae bacterium]|nr:hypothetical protein [Planctomycetaceae bacterium]
MPGLRLDGMSVAGGPAAIGSGGPGIDQVNVRRRADGDDPAPRVPPPLARFRRARKHRPVGASDVVESRRTDRSIESGSD